MTSEQRERQQSELNQDDYNISILIDS